MITKNEFIGIYISFSESKCKSLSSCPYIYELDGKRVFLSSLQTRPEFVLVCPGCDGRIAARDLEEYIIGVFRGAESVD